MSVDEPPGASPSDRRSRFYFGAGAVGTLGGFLGGDGISDTLEAGVAVQHIGGPYETTVYSQLEERFATFSSEVASFLRAGLAYTVTLSNDTVDERGVKDPLVSLRLGAEYHHQLGARGVHPADAWGVGAEATLFGVLSVRAGGTIPSSDSFYGEEGTLHLRYGGGVRLALAEIGSSLPPIVLRADYASIPVVNQAKTTSALSVSIAYTGALLP
jgi:hypothetical protein